LVESSDEFLGHRRGERIELVRPVQRYGGYAVANGVADSGVNAHFSSTVHPSVRLACNRRRALPPLGPPLGQPSPSRRTYGGRSRILAWSRSGARAVSRRSGLIHFSPGFAVRVDPICPPPR